MTGTRRQTKPSTVRVEQPAKLPRSARLFGPVRIVMPAISQTHTPYQFDAFLHCYLVPRTRLDDVMAAIELAGHHVDIPMAGWA